MAVRGWGGSIAIAIGVAAGAGAAQLGLGYGLGIIAWLPSTDSASEASWVASLAWATWIAATSVVAGALTADRVGGTANTAADRVGGSSTAATDSVGASSTAATDRAAGLAAGSATEREPGVTPLAAALWRLALAMAAAVGALVTVALVAVPSRAATRADTFTPQTIAAGYAIVGVLVGLFVAVCALASRAVAANVFATGGWLWLLAVVAVINGVIDGRGLTSAQLAAWKFTGDGDGYWFHNLYLPGMALSLGSALVIGALAGWPGARRRDGRVGVAVSGAVGPFLVAIAYFLAAPKLVNVKAEQLSAYLVAPYAVIAGLAGSVLIALIVGRSTGLPAGAVPAQRTAGGDPDPAGLEDDAYAPARAYPADGAAGDVTDEASPARGRATPAEPLWPDDVKPATGRAKPQPGRGGNARTGQKQPGSGRTARAKKG